MAKSFPLISQERLTYFSKIYQSSVFVKGYKKMNKKKKKKKKKMNFHEMLDA